MLFQTKRFISKGGEDQLGLSVVTIEINLSVRDALDEIRVSKKTKCQGMIFFLLKRKRNIKKHYY